MKPENYSPNLLTPDDEDMTASPHSQHGHTNTSSIDQQDSTDDENVQERNITSSSAVPGEVKTNTTPTLKVMFLKAWLGFITLVIVLCITYVVIEKEKTAWAIANYKMAQTLSEPTLVAEQVEKGWFFSTTKRKYSSIQERMGGTIQDNLQVEDRSHYKNKPADDEL